MDLELYIERIEQYETGAMSAADRSAFEIELASNTALRQAHALFLQANDVIEQGIENLSVKDLLFERDFRFIGISLK